MMVMRWQLAYPGQPIPLIGSWLGEDRAPQGIMLPEFYNQLGAMHGTIMVFLGIVPLAVGAFRELCDAAANRRPGHGIPEAQHDELLGLLSRRRHNVVELRHAGRSRELGMDIVSAIVRYRNDRPDSVAHRHGFSYHLFAAWISKFYHHDNPATRERTHIHASAVFSSGRSL